MAVGFLDLVRVNIPTTGTGSTLTLGSALAGWLDFSTGGGVNGTVYSYGIIDGNNTEVGTITYNSGTGTLSGRTPTKSTNSNAAINLSGNAVLAVTLRAEDAVTPFAGSSLPLSGAGFGISSNPLPGPLYMGSGGLAIGYTSAPPTNGLIVAGQSSFGTSTAPPAGYNALFQHGIQVGNGATGLNFITLDDGTQSWSWAVDQATAGNFYLVQAGVSGNRLVFTMGGKAGVFVSAPLSTLDVGGNLAVGTYAGANAAPSNGLIVSGQVAFGTPTPVAGAALTTSGGAWNGTLGTGAGQISLLTSANTGFGNFLGVQNTGTLSNTSTVAELFVTLGGANNLTMVASGGASPSGSISTGTGLTGGFGIIVGAGSFSLSSPGTQFYGVNSGAGYEWSINSVGYVLLIAGNLLPVADNGTQLGGTGNRWATSYMVALNVGAGVAPDSPLTVNANTVASPGTLISGTMVHLVGATNARMLLDGFAGPGNFTARRANGTAASPTVLAANDAIFGLTAVGWSGSDYTSTSRAAINMFASEAWSGTANGTYLTFSVTANTTAAQFEAMRLGNQGNLGIGTTTPLSKLDVSGGVAIGSFAGSTAAPTNGLLVSGDSRLGNGNAYSYFLGNNTGDPLTTISGLALGWNRSAGSGEVGFYNTYTAAADSFNWFQMTGVGTKNLLANLAPTGLWTWPGYTTPGGLGVDVNGNVIAGGYVTPQMYGAAGNGTTDDTTALTNCLASGFPVRLFGKFKITSQITLNIGVGQTLQGLNLVGGGGELSQIICSTSTAGITVNQFYDNNSGNILSRAAQYVIEGITFVLTATGIGTEATVNLTTGIITSGAFVGVLNLIGKPSSSTVSMSGAAVTLGRVTNLNIISDGTGWAHCCLYLQDQRYCSFNQVNIPSGIGAALSSQTQGWGIVVRATYQPLGSAATIIKFFDSQVVGGLVGAAVVPSGAPNFDCTAVTFTNGSANITKAGGGLPTLVGEKVTVSGASVPLPFVSGNQYFVVSATGGTTMQLSATSGGSPITVTGATSATNIIIAPPMDLEGFYWVNSIAIGCGTIALALWGTDGTSNIYYVTGSTFSTSNNIASTTSWGIYSNGVGGPQYNGNNFENASGASGQTFVGIAHFWTAALNGFGAFGSLGLNITAAPAGVTVAGTGVSISGATTNLFTTGNFFV